MHALCSGFVFASMHSVLRLGFLDIQHAPRERSIVQYYCSTAALCCVTKPNVRVETLSALKPVQPDTRTPVPVRPFQVRPFQVRPFQVRPFQARPPPPTRPYTSTSWILCEIPRDEEMFMKERILATPIQCLSSTLRVATKLDICSSDASCKHGFALYSKRS